MSRSEDPFDTYLLRVLCTLISEKSVSRAAIRLNQSQPAISAALRRLRSIFNDPLLVRDKNRMVPTARALQAVEQGERLAALNQAYRTRHGFPFIACVRHYTRAGLFAELASRTARGTEQEFAEALRQIGFISRLRLAQRVSAASLQPA